MKIDAATLVRARCNVFFNEMMEHSGASDFLLGNWLSEAAETLSYLSGVKVSPGMTRELFTSETPTSAASKTARRNHCSECGR